MKATRLIQKFFVIVLFAAGFSASAQTPSYSCYITNEVLVNPTTYQFDVYLLNTGGATFEYAAGQWGISVNPTIANGGTLSAKVVQSSTLLSNAGQANITAQLNSMTNSLNIAAKAPPGTGNGSVISTVNGGCASPGTRVVTVQIINTVAFTKNTTMDHEYAFASKSGVTATKVFAYVNGLNTDVTSSGKFYAYNSAGTCTQNIVLNADLSTGVNSVNSSTSGYFNVFPNPTTGPVKVMFLGKSNGHYKLSLIDTIDREIWTKEGTAAKGDNKLDFDLKGLAKGVYMMTLEMDGKTSKVKTIVQ